MGRDHTGDSSARRAAGILMPISALPSRYGIGTLGKEAYKFVDFAHEAGCKVWQVLPLQPTSFGNSPYSSCAPGDSVNIVLISIIFLLFIFYLFFCSVPSSPTAAPTALGGEICGKFVVRRAGRVSGPYGESTHGNRIRF